MDKWQAIHSFWSSFGLPAYDEASVPDDAVLPYITYNATVDSLDSPTVLSGDIWYKSTSWEDVSKKADEINNNLVNGGVTISLDIGYLWIVKGQPFAQRIAEEDDNIKHVYIVLMGEFLTY